MPVKLVAFNLFNSLLDERKAMRLAYSGVLENLGLSGEGKYLEDILIVDALKGLSEERARVSWWRDFFADRGISPTDGELKKALKVFWIARLNYSKVHDGANSVLTELKLLKIKTAALSLETADKNLIRFILRKNNLSYLIDILFCVTESGRGGADALNSMVEDYELFRGELAYVDSVIGTTLLAQKEGFRAIWLCLGGPCEATRVPHITNLRDLPKALKPATDIYR